jgi:hypothetical protein
MSRTAARVTQADVARCVKAAMRAGAAGVEIRRDGSIFISLAPPIAGEIPTAPDSGLEADECSDL